MGDVDLGGLPLKNVTFAFGGVDMDVDTKLHANSYSFQMSLRTNVKQSQ
jgi:hypothetical protein